MPSPDATAQEAVTHAPILLTDYRVPDFLIDTVDLHFDLGDEATTVRARLRMRRNKDAASDAPLVFDGGELELVSVAVDDAPLSPEQYDVDDSHLTIPEVPDEFTIATEVRIHPATNTAFEGLYRSSGIYITQCEAEGFRRITYYLDRPDVLAKFTTTIEANRAAYPVLLSNGNPVRRGDGSDGDKHFVTWEDPHKKPCYLFALVAGDLDHIETHYETSEGRDVTLRIYTTSANIGKCDHAMRSLEKSMQWDEQVFGLACDLDYYSIVVTDDFNMGAMENKGLNVFNSKYVLARQETATDADFAGIEGVIAHEYFHNWTGNRVTCRDWFQLSLKEGLTVFRDQQFSGDMNSPAIQRIDDVRVLRNVQFPEDAGPMAHPVRPASVIEINNFYTTTVYQKGAEVVRMYHTLLGAEGFRKGMDLYFERFDGQAVTCDDFRQTMAEANGRDLDLFANWYSQAGTPTVRVESHYDAGESTYTLVISQSCPATPGLENDEPFHIPLAVGLLHADGNDLPLRLDGQPTTTTTEVLELTERRQAFTFVDIPNLGAAPVPSLLRGFSAPVNLEYDYADDELAVLMAHDSDAFCRWDASQKLMSQCLESLIADRQAGRPLALADNLIEAFRRTLDRQADDPALAATLLTLPSESFIGDQMDVIDVESVHEVRQFVRRAIGGALRDPLLATYRSCRNGNAYSLDPAEVARRSMQGTCLAYLMTLGDAEIQSACLDQFQAADNMTDVMAALVNLCYTGTPGFGEALEQFYGKWNEDTLVVDKWFSIQATSPRPGTLDNVEGLMDHAAFSMKNPNKVRALIGGFCGQNRINFHHRDGAGYTFLADRVIELNKINPQIAARLAGILNHWKRYDDGRRQLMRAELNRIIAEPNLSRDVYEIAAKALA